MNNFVQVIERTEINKIISVSLHHIDVSGKTSKKNDLPVDHEDLDGYLSGLLSEINKNPSRRSYEFPLYATGFKTTLASYFKNRDLSNNSESDMFSLNLLTEEMKVESNMEKLNKNNDGHVNKGSFLQFLFVDEGVVSYLGVKIDFQDFIDEEDFKIRSGLAVKRKIYKAVKVSYNVDGSLGGVYIYDKNKKPAVYWWDNFLSLKQARDDSHNTRVAVDEVIKVINTLKSKFKKDSTILRNATLAAFKQERTMDFNEFIGDIFESYVSDDDLYNSEKKDKIIEKLKELPDKKGFDWSFELVPSVVKYNMSKVRLSEEITLVYEEGMRNLSRKIWSDLTDDGRKVVVIESAEGYETFPSRVK